METYNRLQLKSIDHLQMFIKKFIVHGLSISHERGIPEFKDFKHNDNNNNDNDIDLVIYGPTECNQGVE